MAIRNIVKLGDDILAKKCREVTVFDDRLHELLNDMIETLQAANGVGLAAPQVGMLKRVAIVDTGEQIIEFINPEIVSQSGEQTDYEGCLSYPGKYGLVTRPNVVTVRACDRYGKKFEVTGEELMARAFCHEVEHLDGHMYIEKVTEWLEDEELEEMQAERRRKSRFQRKKK